MTYIWDVLEGAVFNLDSEDSRATGYDETQAKTVKRMLSIIYDCIKDVPAYADAKTWTVRGWTSLLESLVKAKVADLSTKEGHDLVRWTLSSLHDFDHEPHIWRGKGSIHGHFTEYALKKNLKLKLYRKFWDDLRAISDWRVKTP